MADDITQGGTSKGAADELTGTVNGVATVIPLPYAQRIKIDSSGTDGSFRDTSRTFPFPVEVIASGAISVVNSTSTNLAGGATFTGTSEDVSGYSTIAVTVFASHASATNGLSVEQSSNGTNWDLTDTYTVPAATGKTFNFAVAAKFYRLVYTNGATLTTSLRIQTLYTAVAKRGSSIKPQDARGNDNDMEEVVGYLALYDAATDTWNRARGTAKGVQGSNALATQDLKDSGRVSKVFSATFTGATTEALVSLIPITDGNAGTGATTFAVTTGKRFRVEALIVTTRNAAAAAQGVVVNLRVTVTGAPTTASALVATAAAGTGIAIANVSNTGSAVIPDGLELIAAQGFAVSQVGSATANNIVTLIGYEY